MDKLKPDFTQAEKFLEFLDEETDSFCFQTFDDDKKRKDKSLARVLFGTVEQHKKELERLNRCGAGIFITVNETNGKGRKRENITRIRTVFQEDDTGNTPTLPIEPHVIVQSSPGKCHRYIFTDSNDVDEFEPVQQRLVDDYGSDPNAKDRARVLRLPGFFHMKNPNKPHLVRVVSTSGQQPLSWEEVKNNFPAC